METAELIQNFLVWLGGAHAHATVSSYRFALHSFVKYLAHIQKKAVDCTLDDLSRYVLWLENKGLKPSTRAIYVTSLKTFWQWMHRQGMVSFSENMIPTPPSVDKVSYPFLEPEEFRTLLNACGDLLPVEIRNKAGLALLYATGMRIGEFLSLNVSDLDFVNHKAIVKTFKRKDHKREIFWDDETNDHLKRWIDVRRQILDRSGRGCEALWLSLDTANEPARVGKHAFEHLLLRLRKQLGMEKKITPHSFRHGFGYRGTKANANIRHLQIMMGHAKLSTTQIYMGYKDQEVEEEYRRVMEIEKLTSPLADDNLLVYASTGKDETEQGNILVSQKGRSVPQVSGNVWDKRKYRVSYSMDGRTPQRKLGQPRKEDKQFQRT